MAIDGMGGGFEVAQGGGEVDRPPDLRREHRIPGELRWLSATGKEGVLQTRSRLWGRCEFGG